MHKAAIAIVIAAALIAAGLLGYDNKRAPEAASKHQTELLAKLDNAIKGNTAGIAGEVKQRIEQDRAQLQAVIVTLKSATASAEPKPAAPGKNPNAREPTDARK